MWIQGNTTVPTPIAQNASEVASPSGNFTPWQVHILPGSQDLSYMTVVWATGQYIAGLSDAGTPCQSTSYQFTGELVKLVTDRSTSCRGPGAL